jgi:hypothetical protein
MQTLAWCRPDEALTLRSRALEVNDGLHNLVEIVKINAASAVALAQTGQMDASEAEVVQGLALTEEAGYPGGQVWCWVARTARQMLSHDVDSATESAATVRSVVTQLHGNRFWSQIANWWVGSDAHQWPGDTTMWLEGEAAARARWLAACGGDGMSGG